MGDSKEKQDPLLTKKKDPEQDYGGCALTRSVDCTKSSLQTGTFLRNITTEQLREVLPYTKSQVMLGVALLSSTASYVGTGNEILVSGEIRRMIFRCDLCGIFCALFTYSAMVYADYVVIVWLIIPTFMHSLWGVLHAVMFNTVLFFAFTSHLRAMVTDPGIIPISRKGLLRCNKSHFSKLIPDGESNNTDSDIELIGEKTSLWWTTTSTSLPYLSTLYSQNGSPLLACIQFVSSVYVEYAWAVIEIFSDMLLFSIAKWVPGLITASASTIRNIFAVFVSSTALLTEEYFYLACSLIVTTWMFHDEYDMKGSYEQSIHHTKILHTVFLSIESALFGLFVLAVSCDQALLPPLIGILVKNTTNNVPKNISKDNENNLLGQCWGWVYRKVLKPVQIALNYNKLSLSAIGDKNSIERKALNSAYNTYSLKLIAASTKSLIIDSTLRPTYSVAIQAILNDETAVEAAQRKGFHNRVVLSRSKITLIRKVCGNGPIILWLLPCSTLPSERDIIQLSDQSFIA
ncbi:Palmitoyltransferase [Dirofilaria immitis]|nr:Palmitoyltransferase [Dirofilaria immitis]